MSSKNFETAATIIMVPAYYDTEAEAPSADRTGTVIFTSGALPDDVGKGYEFYVKARKTKGGKIGFSGANGGKIDFSDGKIAFSGKLFPPRVNKDHKPEAVYYINFVQNTKDSQAVLIVFIKTIPENEDEESKTLYIGNMFRGAVPGVTKGNVGVALSERGKREDAPPLEKASSGLYGDLTF